MRLHHARGTFLKQRTHMVALHNSRIVSGRQSAAAPDDATLSRLSRGQAIKMPQACPWCERDQLTTRRTASASWLAFRVAYAWVARGRVSSVVYSQRDVLLAFMWASHRAAVSSGLVWGLGVRPSEGGLALRAQRQAYGISLLLFPSRN
jgi:hypothetical protein